MGMPASSYTALAHLGSRFHAAEAYIFLTFACPGRGACLVMSADGFVQIRVPSEGWGGGDSRRLFTSLKPTGELNPSKGGALVVQYKYAPIITLTAKGKERKKKLPRTLPSVSAM